MLSPQASCRPMGGRCHQTVTKETRNERASPHSLSKRVNFMTDLPRNPTRPSPARSRPRLTWLSGMKRSTLVLLILVAAAGLVVAAAASILHDGLSSRATPTALEALLARNARGLAIPHGARAAKNPIASSPEVATRRASTFRRPLRRLPRKRRRRRLHDGPRSVSQAARPSLGRRPRNSPTANSSGSSRTASASRACRRLAGAALRSRR